MFNDFTPHTDSSLKHYQGDGATMPRRNPLEAVVPIVMIVVGIAGILLMFVK